MKYSSEGYTNGKAGTITWVEERYVDDFRAYGYVVMLGEIKEGLEQWQDFIRNGGVISVGDVKGITIETRAFASGEPAFRYALESAGKDPSMARSEFEKFLSIPRKMQALDPKYRPRSDDEKEK